MRLQDTAGIVSMKLNSRWVVIFLACLVLSACAAGRQETDLEETTKQYGVLIRWNEIGQATNFVHPDALPEANRLQFELDRFDQVRITGYDITAVAPDQEGVVYRQTVAIRIYNKHTAVERTIIDQQLWEYDAENERWWLMSGLPDLRSRGR